MRLTLLAIIATSAVLVSTQALAQYPGAQIDQSCNTGNVGFACRTVIGPREWPSARIIKVPRPTDPVELEAQAVREAEHDRVCDPIPVIGRDGISRMTWNANCPNGYIVGDGKRPRP